MHQTNCNTHNKARIPATISQQVYDYCSTTSLQQVHNRMILYGNQALVLYGNHFTTRLQQVHDKDVTVVDLLWTCCGDKIFSISTTGPQHLQHVHNTFTTVYANGNAFTPRAKQSHNHYNTFTTNLRLICNKRTAILTTRLEFLQQFHDRSTITVSQQVYNRFTTGWFYMETRLKFELFSSLIDFRHR